MQDPPASNPTGYPFTETELEALRSYRAAIAARLSVEREMDTVTVEGECYELEFISAQPGASPYRFTPTELARLAAYRAAIQAGLYHDGAPMDPPVPEGDQS